MYQIKGKVLEIIPTKKGAYILTIYNGKDLMRVYTKKKFSVNQEVQLSVSVPRLWFEV